MEFSIANYRFFTPIEVRWNDLDALGHVNNVYYIDYFQQGRGKFINEASKTWDWFKNMFVIAQISCNYVQEIRLDVKQLQIGVRISRLGTKSFDIEYALVSEGKDREVIVHAIGASTQVMVSLADKKAIELPEWFVKEVKEYEPSL
ncbi:acyl-CoA thioesterase [Myroides pelagicus]|uniref:Acyl-CoA thioesterase n=1 Tax=Myroides pelagicus TaxID=270914 RepID=A0A7K1GPS1_9FLAO|nr:thioesterase family protein [Myroides pelagicus]MEC4114640.1 thioesterase family protein [Myroides pelagicus]MTH30720.1 acyl-CoA thioesterase [Myroides pelagicus]